MKKQLNYLKYRYTKNFGFRNFPRLFQTATSRVSAIAVLTVCVPLVLTFYTWYMAKQAAFEKNQSRFETLAMESEKALVNRINAYNHALLGVAGFYQGSEHVTFDDWREYVDAIQVRKNYPGISGLGMTVVVNPDEIDSFTARARQEISPDFKIYPETEGLPYYITTFFHPERNQRNVLGLNLAFEEKRRTAAELARDSGQASMTGRVELVRDYPDQTGFILFYPLYKRGMPLSTVEQRRQAFKNWVYIPFNAENFFNTLTDDRNNAIRLSVYDGKVVDENNLIYGEDRDIEPRHQSRYKVVKTLNMMQRDWTLVWESTASFERQNTHDSLVFILVGGLGLTGLLAVFLIITSVQNADIMKRVGGEKQFVLPVIIFMVSAFGAFAFYHAMSLREETYIWHETYDEARKIEQLIISQTESRLDSLSRMSRRWGAAGGTPEDQWRSDARDHLSHIGGLHSLEWVGKDYRIAMIEPQEAEASLRGLYIRHSPERIEAVDKAVAQNIMTLTPPVELFEGGKAFIAYAPAFVGKEFVGMTVGIFKIERLFRSILSSDIYDNYAIIVSYDGDIIFEHNADVKLLHDFAVSHQIRLVDKVWTFKLIPTKRFIQLQTSLLPTSLLVAGLLIAVLLSLTVHYILISRLRSHHLKLSEETFREAMKNAPISMALLNITGKWLNVNQSLCDFVGYTEDELLRTGYQRIAHPDDLQEDLGYIKNMITGKKQTYHVEKRYIHKKGHIVWGAMNVSLARDADGQPKYFILQIQDITERRKIDQIKSEFISIVSHELRTPLTSIRGSLGLIEGTMSDSLPDRANKLISIAHKNCERLILLINDILDLDKISAGKMRFHLKDENLSDLVFQGIESNKGYGDKFNVRFEVGTIPDNVIIHVDADRWQQVLSNLLSNAAKFSPENGTVTVWAEMHKGRARVCVKDEGPGVPPEFRKRVFGKFSQADSTSTRTKGGTGLGLNISKKIVESMKGQIGFESEVGSTVFWFEFPAKTDLADDSIVDASPADHRIKILHVEDDLDFIRMIEVALDDENIRIESAQSMDIARQKLDRDDFSLVILDLNLQGDSAGTLIDYIHDKGKDVPIIILSADDPVDNLNDKVLSVLVKSRVSEQVVVDTIMAAVRHMKTESDVT